ncbi:unnamed protein product, partial [marine sediment metagenome]
MSQFEKEILSLLRKIDEKLNKLLDSNNLETASERSATPTGEKYVKPSTIVEKQEEEEKAKEKPPIEGRRVCPACGGTSFNTEEDKS